MKHLFVYLFLTHALVVVFGQKQLGAKPIRKLYRITPKVFDQTTARNLRSFIDEHEVKREVRFVDEFVHRGKRSINLAVNADKAKKIEKALLNLVLDGEVNETHSNLDALFESVQHHKSDVTFKMSDPWEGFRFDQYHSYLSMMNFMKAIQAENPNLINIFSIGNSYENRPMLALRIGVPKPGIEKPTIWVDAGIHAREWIAPASAIYFIHRLVSDFDKDEKTRNMLENIDWVILPCANPDGYEYSRNHERMWRKTRSRRQCSFFDCCAGADPNRNFGYFWGGEGTSQNPCNEIYRGPKAFSEPETKNIGQFLYEKRNELKAYFTLHAFSQMWLIPYGYLENGPLPDNYEEMMDLGYRASNATAHHDPVYGPYLIGNSARTMYTAAGSSDDFAKGVAGIRYSYTIELPPADDTLEQFAGNGFILEPRYILPVASNIYIGVTVVADKVLADYEYERLAH